MRSTLFLRVWVYVMFVKGASDEKGGVPRVEPGLFFWLPKGQFGMNDEYSQVQFLLSLTEARTVRTA